VSVCDAEYKNGVLLSVLANDVHSRRTLKLKITCTSSLCKQFVTTPPTLFFCTNNAGHFCDPSLVSWEFYVWSCVSLKQHI